MVNTATPGTHVNMTELSATPEAASVATQGTNDRIKRQYLWPACVGNIQVSRTTLQENSAEWNTHGVSIALNLVVNLLAGREAFR